MVTSAAVAVTRHPGNSGDPHVYRTLPGGIDGQPNYRFNPNTVTEKEIASIVSVLNAGVNPLNRDIWHIAHIAVRGYGIWRVDSAYSCALWGQTPEELATKLSDYFMSLRGSR